MNLLILQNDSVTGQLIIALYFYVHTTIGDRNLMEIADNKKNSFYFIFFSLLSFIHF
jgi:hypothetical protein